MGALLGRRERRQFAPEPVIPPYLGAFGSNATPDNALHVPAVWACVNLLANTISSMALQTFRQAGDVATRITDPLVVTNPAAGMTQSEWLHMLVVSLLLRGNAYGLLTFGAGFRATQIELLNPDLVHVVIDENGALRYKLRGGTDGEQDVTARMWHVRGMTLP